MALDLEIEVMRDIGLGMPYHWFNGSGSCDGIRRRAAEQLRDAIQKRHADGAALVAPVESLCAVARQAVAWDDSQYSLTKTWQVCSEVIRAHMELVYIEPVKRLSWAGERAAEIRRLYAPSVRAPQMDADYARSGWIREQWTRPDRQGARTP